MIGMDGRRSTRAVAVNKNKIATEAINGIHMKLGFLEDITYAYVYKINGRQANIP